MYFEWFISFLSKMFPLLEEMEDLEYLEDDQADTLIDFLPM